MLKKQSIKNYIVPMLCAFLLLVILGTGTFYIRTYMMQQTVKERSSQLEEMVAQIQVNLESGLETYWNFLSGIEKVMEGKAYADEDDLIDNIVALEDELCTDLYGCRVMLLDKMGMAYLDEGAAGIWDDINRLAGGETRQTFVSDTSNVDGTFLAFCQKLRNPVTLGEDANTFTHIVLLKNIDTLKKYYTTETYGGKAATYIIK